MVGYAEERGNKRLQQSDIGSEDQRKTHVVHRPQRAVYTRTSV